ncbi:hypothetical protein GCM10010329_73030 [Streptomyces spiroverticillatus]|nr:hypothetical protein GCM10010329_73030 [Streptomyces spiroverticillatus]
MLAALLAFTAVFALLVGAEPGAGSSASGDVARSAGALPGSAESEGTQDGSADPELRLQLGGVRRVHELPAPSQARPRGGPPAPPVHAPPVVPLRTSPVRPPVPYAARCAVLRC